MSEYKSVTVDLLEEMVSINSTPPPPGTPVPEPVFLSQGARVGEDLLWVVVWGIFAEPNHRPWDWAIVPERDLQAFSYAKAREHKTFVAAQAIDHLLARTIIREALYEATPVALGKLKEAQAKTVPGTDAAH